MKKILLILFACLSFSLIAFAQTYSPTANVLYVKKGATGNGSSWTNAVGELANALKWAHQNKANFTNAAPLQIWVANGTYKPMYTPEDGQDFSATPANPRDKAFLMVNNVKLYGGFVGTETGIGERTNLPTANGGGNTILSGDLNNNDAYDASVTVGNKTTGNTNADNANHVLLVADTEALNITIDGFSITGGNANVIDPETITTIIVNGHYISRHTGGGIFTRSFAATNLTNLSVNNNTAYAGAAISTSSNGENTALISLNNSSVNNNTASRGGGIFFSTSKVSVNHSSVNNNRAIDQEADGGGIYSNSSDVSLKNSSVNNNTASSNGGGIFSTYFGPVNLTNSTVNNNTASLGGGIFSDLYSTVSLKNSTVNNNTASSNGGAIFSFAYGSSSDVKSVILKNVTMANNKGSSFIRFEGSDANKLTVYNSNIFGNQVSATNNASSTMTAGGGNTVIDKDIKYSLVQGEAANAANNVLNGTSTSEITRANLFNDFSNGDYTLKIWSAAINAGNNQLYTDAGGNLATDKDLAGNPRLIGSKIDMGAYENQTIISPTAGILYVNKHVTGGNQSGGSWANAIAELADALKWANQNKANFTPAAPLLIWVANGTYYPMYSPIDGDNLTAPVNSRDKTFLMVDNVVLVGGFVGTETGVGQRTNLPAANGGGNTILSGDLNKNDAYDTSVTVGNKTTGNTNADNAYHVVLVTNNSAINAIDGFSITGGNANGSDDIKVNVHSIPRNYGSGIYSYSPVFAVNLNNLSVNNNTAAYGGGIYSASNSFLSLKNSGVNNNTATNGGGIYSLNSSPGLNNSSVNNNTATNGGGIYSHNSTVSLNNSTVNNNNTASFDGSGIYSYSNTTTKSVMLNNVTMANNKGSSFLFFQGSATNRIGANNSIIFGNQISATNTANSTIAANNNAFINKEFRYSLVQNEAANAANNVLDGLSTSAITSTNLFNNFANGDYTLKNGSAAINNGNNQLYTDAGGDLATDKDLAGNPRLVDGTIDMGTYENQTITVLPVNFGKFTATLQSNRVKLGWNTFSEQENQAFIIYRSTDGKTYTEIAQTPSKGNSANNYTIFDNSPANGVNYYRLKQKDIDGTITELGDDAVNFSLNATKVKAWPNPVERTLKVSFTAGKYQSLGLKDITGKKLQERSLANTQSEIELDMGGYPKGVYVIELKGNSGSHAVKVLK